MRLTFECCVHCAVGVSSIQFPPSLFAEFALIPCPLLSFACFTPRSAMRSFLTLCSKKLTSFYCVWVDFALGMDPRFPGCERNSKKSFIQSLVQRSGMLTLVCVFVHVRMDNQICANSGYAPPPSPCTVAKRMPQRCRFVGKN
jgi:hypothetical protein